MYTTLKQLLIKEEQAFFSLCATFTVDYEDLPPLGETLVTRNEKNKMN